MAPSVSIFDIVVKENCQVNSLLADTLENFEILKYCVAIKMKPLAVILQILICKLLCSINNCRRKI